MMCIELANEVPNFPASLAEQSVDSRHDQPFFLSRQSDPATLDLESPEWSGDSSFRVARVIWQL